MIAKKFLLCISMLSISSLGYAGIEQRALNLYQYHSTPKRVPNLTHSTNTFSYARPTLQGITFSRTPQKEIFNTTFIVHDKKIISSCTLPGRLFYGHQEFDWETAFIKPLNPITEYDQPKIIPAGSFGAFYRIIHELLYKNTQHFAPFTNLLGLIQSWEAGHLKNNPLQNDRYPQQCGISCLYQECENIDQAAIIPPPEEISLWLAQNDAPATCAEVTVPAEQNMDGEKLFILFASIEKHINKHYPRKSWAQCFPTKQEILDSLVHDNNIRSFNPKYIEVSTID